jgi:DNA-binding HxlR family transcriptional regulator
MSAQSYPVHRPKGSHTKVRVSQSANCTRPIQFLYSPRCQGRPTVSVEAEEKTAMTQAGYKQFCPLSMAAEVLCTRWTMVLMRELVAGSTRFNDLRRGVPKMSPTLLSQRLKELELAGIVERKGVAGEKGIFEYRLTEAGRDLRAVVEAMGFWGQKWVESRLSLKNLDPSLLMWDMRRNLNPTPLPEGRTVIQFLYQDLPASKRSWWLIVEKHGEVDLCWYDPGFEIDLYVSTDLHTMTAIWMGVLTVEKAGSKVVLTGDLAIGRQIQTWLGLSPFAVVAKRAA